LLFHLIDAEVGPISKSAVLRAAAWGDYLEAHARKVYALGLRGAEQATAALGRHIRLGDTGNIFRARDIYRKGWSGLDNETTQAAIDELVDLGWLRGTSNDLGRRTMTYTVNPMLKTGG
jgi:putative DNA primase/helicase